MSEDNNINDSYAKGGIFEQYIKDIIFDKSNYDLLHITPSDEQIKERYIESSKKPDFKFRCKKTKQEFFVEAKYRARYDLEDKVKLLDLDRYIRYKEYETPEIPVFIAIGIGGKPNKPVSISLIPLDEFKHEKLFKSVIKKYEIDHKRSLNAKKLVSLINKEEIQTKKAHSSFKRIISKKTLWPLVILFFMLVFFIIFYSLKIGNGSNKKEEQKLKSQIQAYYDALENDNLEVLDYFINEKVSRWYNSSNVDLNTIKKDLQKYYYKYPFRIINIDWDSFIMYELPNNDYVVSYILDYKIKSKANGNYSTYILNIKAIWSQDFKIKSMYEEQLNKN